MKINISKLIEVLDKFKDHLDMLLVACRTHMGENEELLKTLDGPGIDDFMSSFLNIKLRDEGIEASPEEINYLGLCISTEILKEALESRNNPPE
jgi:hypothetical protein